MNKFLEFEDSYKSAIESIKEYQNNKDIGVFVNWLLETDINPYSFLDNGNLLSTAEGFAFLCHIVHHALVDDGDITFLTIDGQPKIKFEYQYDIKVPTKEVHKLDKSGDKPKIVTHIEECKLEFLDNYHEFIEAIEIYETEHLKKCFLMDKNFHGAETAISAYSKYKRYDESWNELEDESCGIFGKSKKKNNNN